jgi:hypothetical protein
VSTQLSRSVELAVGSVVGRVAKNARFGRGLMGGGGDPHAAFIYCKPVVTSKPEKALRLPSTLLMNANI